jgi:hypothetical protein
MVKSTVLCTLIFKKHSVATWLDKMMLRQFADIFDHASSTQLLATPIVSICRLVHIHRVEKYDLSRQNTSNSPSQCFYDVLGVICMSMNIVVLYRRIHAHCLDFSASLTSRGLSVPCLILAVLCHFDIKFMVAAFFNCQADTTHTVITTYLLPNQPHDCITEDRCHLLAGFIRLTGFLDGADIITQACAYPTMD